MTIKAHTHDFKPSEPDVNNRGVSQVIAKNIIKGSKLVLMDMSKSTPTLVFGSSITPQDWDKAQRALTSRSQSTETGQ